MASFVMRIASASGVLSASLPSEPRCHPPAAAKEQLAVVDEQRTSKFLLTNGRTHLFEKRLFNQYQKHLQLARSQDEASHRSRKQQDAERFFGRSGTESY
jgi:hypothetical protein